MFLLIVVTIINTRGVWTCVNYVVPLDLTAASRVARYPEIPYSWISNERLNERGASERDVEV